MQQVGQDREQGRLLSAMLAAGGGEGRPDLAVERAARPQPAPMVQESGHLRAHPPEAGAGADHNRVIPFELGDGRDRRGLVELVVAAARHLLGTVSGTRRMSTLAPAPRAPSAIASAIVSI
jgi:hypothetical protein